jgi:hypothetical protein
MGSDLAPALGEVSQSVVMAKSVALAEAVFEGMIGHYSLIESTHRVQCGHVGVRELNF